jgi:hypothetical protein
MATITAKTGSNTPLNVLDPETWVGGVVPGPADIAVFPHHPYAQSFYIPDAISSIVLPYASYIFPWGSELDGQVRLRLYGNTGFSSTSGSLLFKPYGSFKNYVKVDYRFMTGTTTNTYLHSCSLDRSYTNTTCSVVPGNNWIISGSIEGDDNYAFGYIGNALGQLIPFTASAPASGAMQGPLMYELTGSQQWAVGTVRMGDHNQFVIKNTAKLLLTTGSTPSVDFFTNTANWSSIIVQDSATIEVSSSLQNNVQAQANSGIYLNTAANNYVLISGSANYSSSVTTAQATAGTSHIDLQDTSGFDIGDWISVQSDINYIGRMNVSGSTTSSFTSTGNILNPTGSAYSKSIGHIDFFTTGTPETDEVVRIEKISGSRVYVSKRLGYQGYIHQNLGTFTYKQFAETFKRPVEYYSGSKRVLLVETNHHAFKAGDWVGTDEGVFRVFQTNTYLTQSKFVDFTNPQTQALQEFCKSPYAFSGSGYSGATAGPTYQDQLFSYQYIATGSRNGKYSFFLNSASLSTASNATVQTYLRGNFFISGSWFKEGEIELSGSLIQDFTKYSGSLNESIGLVWPVKPSQREDYQLHVVSYGDTAYPRENNAFGVRGDGTIYYCVDGSTDSNRDGFIILSGSNKRDFYNDNDFYNILPSSSFSAIGTEVSLKVRVQGGYTELFANGVFLGKWCSLHDSGGVSVQLRRFASLFSVSIKNLYDLIILDTEEEISSAQDLREAGLMETHAANKTVKWWATEVEDEMGHRNLVWEYWRTKGQTGIMPYLHSFTFGHNTINTCQTYLTAYQNSRFLNFNPQYEYGFTAPVNMTASVAGLNHLTVDLGTSVTFDTIGISPAIGNSLSEYGNNGAPYFANYMRQIKFEVSDTPDSWQEVYATQDDLRISAGSSAIRYYTLPSGSVTKRFIRYHNAGGDRSAEFSGLSLFGVYNFQSASGYLPNTQNQIKLRSVKNIRVGDSIMFWSKQYGSSVRGITQTADGSSWGNQLNTNLVQSTTIVNNLLSGSYYTPAVSGSSYKVTGGYKRSYDIIAISGSVVTLDRPVTEDYLSRGTIVMKTDRGTVSLKKNVFNDRCGVYSTSAYNQLKLQNASIEGQIVWYSTITQQNTPTYIAKIEDIGCDWGQDSTNSFVNMGLFRNIVTAAGISITAGRTQDRLPAPVIVYNTFQRLAYNETVYYSPCNYGVYNHNTFSHMNDGILYSNPGSGVFPQWIRKKTYIKNNFFDCYKIPNQFYANINDDGIMSNIIWTGNVILSVSHNYGNRYISYTLVPSANQPYTPAYFMQHYAHNAFAPASSNGRCTIITTTGENISQGVLVKNSPVFNEPFIAIGNINTTYTIIRKDRDWYNMIFPHADKTPAVAYYHQTSDLGCIFNVNNQCDVTFDLSFDYKSSPAMKYSYNPTYPLHYDTNFYVPSILLIDENQQVLDKHIDGFRSLSPVGISYNKTLNLAPGIYSLVFAWAPPYYTNLGVVGVSYKNMNFKLLTEDVNNITVTKNTWDMHRMLEDQTLYQIENYRPDRIGAKTVSKVVNNVATTTKFNNVRI